MIRVHDPFLTGYFMEGIPTPQLHMRKRDERRA